MSGETLSLSVNLVLEDIENRMHWCLFGTEKNSELAYSMCADPACHMRHKKNKM